MMNTDGLLKIKEAVEYGEAECGNVRQARHFMCALAGAIHAEAPDLADRIVEMMPEVEE